MKFNIISAILVLLLFIVAALFAQTIMSPAIGRREGLSGPVVIKINSTVNPIQLAQVVFKDKTGTKIMYNTSNIKATPALDPAAGISNICDGTESPRDYPQIYHSNAENAFVEISLPEMPAYVTIYNRKDCCNERMASYTLSVSVNNSVKNTIKLTSEMAQTYTISPDGTQIAASPLIVPVTVPVTALIDTEGAEV